MEHIKRLREYVLSLSLEERRMVAVTGMLCRKAVPNCYCLTGGRPYEDRYPDCRDNEQNDTDYCVCPPKESIISDSH